VEFLSSILVMNLDNVESDVLYDSVIGVEQLQRHSWRGESSCVTPRAHEPAPRFIHHLHQQSPFAIEPAVKPLGRTARLESKLCTAFQKADGAMIQSENIEDNAHISFDAS
jgi:hypothetical protein